MEQHKNIDEWIYDLIESKDETLTKLGENYEYIVDNFQRFKNNDLHPFELPNLQNLGKSITYFCTYFGYDWFPQPKSYYVVEKRNGTFKFATKYYGTANSQKNNSEIIIEKPVIHDKTHIDKYIDKSYNINKDISNNLKFLKNNKKQFISNDIAISDLPCGERNVRSAIIFSVIFGSLLFEEEPSLVGVFLNGNILRKLCSNRFVAQKHVSPNDRIIDVTLVD